MVVIWGLSRVGFDVIDAIDIRPLKFLRSKVAKGNKVGGQSSPCLTIPRVSLTSCRLSTSASSIYRIIGVDY